VKLLDIVLGLNKSGQIRGQNLLRQFVSREEKTQLKARGIVGIRAMNRIMFDARRPLLANGSFFGIGRVSRPHQLAQIRNGGLFFQRQHDNWAAAHEFSERIEKRPVSVNRIKLLRLMLADFQHFHAQDAETILLKLFDDVADGISLYRVRFNDGKCAF
jgi:hypothetical protein